MRSRPLKQAGAMLAVCVLALLALPACEVGPRISKETGELVQTVKLRNASTRAVRINALVGKRDLDSPMLLDPRLGIKSTIRSGDTKSYDVVLAEPDEKDPPFADELVFRFRLEVINPHWREPRVVWYEMLGPLPELIRVSDGFSGVMLSAPGLDFALVPDEHWQLEEQANAIIASQRIGEDAGVDSKPPPAHEPPNR